MMMMMKVLRDLQLTWHCGGLHVNAFLFRLSNTRSGLGFFDITLKFIFLGLEIINGDIFYYISLLRF